ncbi:UvrD-helicase domain-containing protein [Alteribacillus sp. JSM 102045]|uniref:UvrD-helicase domain-containing protein n=1 Tax=Alteribacillus sp. JSM 102045 TaxID=1562101 RepID=UPI0035BF4EEA
MNLIDQEARDEILEDNGNIVISASAGSGKTTIMVNKMNKVLQEIEDHKTIAAITFTVKASKEIKKKVGINTENSLSVQTNDSFIESEIIRPFIQDALGSDYNREYSVEYDGVYKFSSFEEGLNQLKSMNVLGTYRDNHLNFNFRLALIIIKNSIACQEYIKSKYAMIFIDEYQDTDSDMHRFFMWLKNNLSIKLFIVGDSKQAIYLWRGAMSNVFELLSNENFSAYELVTNFRCDNEIENYANLFHNPGYYKHLNNDVNNVILKEFPSKGRNFVGFLEEFEQLIEDNYVDILKDITIIANFNRDAQLITDILNKNGYNFVYIPRTPIDEGIPNGHLLKELAFYIKNESYSIYDFLSNTQIDERIQTRKDIDKIIKLLKKWENLDQTMISRAVSNLANYLEISISDKEIKKFIESITNRNYDMAFTLLEEKHKVMTVFASKGLEFNQVISFSRYYRIFNSEHLQNHYVCVTRAINKFIMFIDDHRYHKHLTNVIANEQISNAGKVFKHIPSINAYIKQ